MGPTILRLIPVTIIMGAIFFLSHQPGDLFAIYDFRWADKLAHLTVYAALCATVIYAFPKHYRRSAKGMVICVSIVFCLVYGLSDEFHQSFIPGRYPSIADVAADVIGASLACMLWLWWDKSEHTGRLRKRVVK